MPGYARARFSFAIMPNRSLLQFKNHERSGVGIKEVVKVRTYITFLGRVYQLDLILP